MVNQQAVKSERFIPTLDGWRALAILAVLVCHGLSPLFKNPKIHAVLATGAFGVHIFFCLSGFLITKRLLMEFQTKGHISFKDFYLKRFFRIIPPATTYIFIIFLLEGLFPYPIEPLSYLGSLFFFKNFYEDQSWYLSHFWSLSVEEQFYLAWPALLFLFSVKRGLVSGILAYITLIGLTFVAPVLSHTYILTGCILAYVHHYQIWPSLIRLLKKDGVQMALFGLMGLGFLNKIPFRDHSLPWVMGLLILATVSSPSTYLSRVLEWESLKIIGRYSYSIYIWQQLFCVMEPQYISWTFLQQFPFHFMGVAVMAYLSYNFIETPAIRYGRRFIQKL